MVRRIRDLLYDQGFTISGARNKLQEIVQLERDKKRAGEVLLVGVEELEDNLSIGDDNSEEPWSLAGVLTDKPKLQALKRELYEIRELLTEL
jgi:hypothetical protein